MGIAKAELAEISEALVAAKGAAQLATKKLKLSQSILGVIKERVLGVAPDALYTMRHRSAVPQVRVCVRVRVYVSMCAYVRECVRACVCKCAHACVCA